MRMIRFIVLMVILLAGGMNVCAQEKIEIRGTVIDTDGLPAVSTVIRDTDEKGSVYGITDLEGKFKLMALPTASLHFSSMGYKSKVVKVKGKQVLNVVLEYDTNLIGEVVITAKRIVDKFQPEPTDIEISGNYYIIRPKVKIPSEMFKPNTRIVVQPMLTNRTRKESTLFRPAVVTGRQYAIALERMLEFDLSRDPLSAYAQESKRVENNEVIAYRDSLYLDYPDDECYCDIFMYLVKYSKLAYKDTMTIAKGTVNPMRFFAYQAEASKMNDERYLPKPQKQLRGDKGQVRLSFLVNSAKIDDQDPNNAIELEKMRLRLQELDNDPNAEFESFFIKGISSPEGNYQKNLSLARERTFESQRRIFGFLRPPTVVAMKDSTSTESVVEPWESVAALMEEDSISTGALRDILARYPGNIEAQYHQIVKLPVYRGIIVPYLAKLRRVEYRFNYSVMRLLTDEEIEELYRQDYKKLIPYEFWRMYVNAETNEDRESLCRQALEIYPDFIIMANELAAILIGKGTPDSKVLESFVKDDAPVEVLRNQAISLLADRAYDRADSVASMLPDYGSSAEIRDVIAAFNGDYEPAYERLKEFGGVNEVVLLLAMKRNEEALLKAEELPEEVALNDYLRAIACNRLDMLTEAYTYLKLAFREDPELMEVARIDGDVIDLVEGLEAEKIEKMETEKEENKQ